MSRMPLWLVTVVSIRATVIIFIIVLCTISTAWPSATVYHIP
jgi:hypothetical protein